MLLTITAASDADRGGALADATELGFLLHKHPDRVQVFDAPAGVAHVFYPESTPARCTAALLLEVDPVAVVRGGRRGPTSGGSEAFSLAQHVNDRPYAASSLLAVTLGRVFGSAMAGRCQGRQQLADAPLDLALHVPALPCRGGPDVARRLFAPLGWDVDAVPVPLDPTLPAWGDSPYVDLHLRGRVRLAEALHHLYVLLPVLDDAQHYWVGADDVDKLVRAGGGWLADHPERDLVIRRYLKHQRPLVADAASRLAELDEGPGDAAGGADDPPGTPAPGTPAPGTRGAAGRERTAAVLAALRAAGAASVVDLGCGEGRLLQELLPTPGSPASSGST